MFAYHLCEAHHGAILCVFFTLDLSVTPNKLVFYDCLLSTLLKVVVLWIYVQIRHSYLYVIPD